MTKDAIDKLFEDLDDQWDVHEPAAGHADRFRDRLEQKRTRRISPIWWAAAAVVMLMGLWPILKTDFAHRPQTGLELASKQTRETDSIFTAMIRAELEQVKAKRNPVNQKMVQDALVQMEQLDRDYEKIKQELLRSGESKQLIHAMIANLKTRIQFLENVLEHLENNEKLLQQHEDNI